MAFALGGFRSYKRDFPPTHCMVKIDSIYQADIEKYESEHFEAEDYKWSLLFYPNGNKAVNGNGYISLYLVIEERENFPAGWEVHVSFKFFLFDQLRDNYLVIEDTDVAIRRFHALKTEWGYARLLSLDRFKDASNGYLVGDSCVLGVEVFVVHRTCKLLGISFVNSPSNNVMTWTISNFSQVKETCCSSQVFTVEGTKWKLMVYPNGDQSATGKFLSIFLMLAEAGGLPSNQKIYANYELRIRKPVNDTIRGQLRGKAWFSSESSSWGFSKFFPLKELKDSYENLIVQDCLTVEAEILVISKAKSFS